MSSIKKSDWVAISGFLLLLTAIALWSVDVSVSALLSGGHLTNGFSISDPFKLYHIGLYIVILVAFISLFIATLMSGFNEWKTTWECIEWSGHNESYWQHEINSYEPICQNWEDLQTMERWESGCYDCLIIQLPCTKRVMVQVRI